MSFKQKHSRAKKFWFHKWNKGYLTARVTTLVTTKTFFKLQISTVLSKSLILLSWRKNEVSYEKGNFAINGNYFIF